MIGLADPLIMVRKIRAIPTQPYQVFANKVSGECWQKLARLGYAWPSGALV